MKRLICLGLMLVALVLLVLPASQAQKDAKAGKKYAVLVGVNKYSHARLDDLSFTENDVEEVGKLLSKGGYEVMFLTSTRGEADAKKKPTAKNIREELKRVLDKVTKEDTVIVGLSGHGLQFEVDVKGKKRFESFFCPSDAKPRNGATLEELSKTMIGFTELLKDLDDSGVGVKLLLVDACRNEPEGFRAASSASVPRLPKGTAALFSCTAGEKSAEVKALKHGLFFHSVLEALRGKAKNRKGAVTWSSMAEYVTENVPDRAIKLVGRGHQQTPQMLADLSGASPVLLVVEDVEPPNAVVANEEAKKVINSIGMLLVQIPAGTFTQGSTPADRKEVLRLLAKKEEPDWLKAETPQRTVTISKPFFMGVFEVTQAQYKRVMGTNPSYYCAEGDGKISVVGMNTNEFPVEEVTYADVKKFCLEMTKLDKKAGFEHEYRLPTEAEWEYACRAGTKTATHYGDALSSTMANFNGNWPYGRVLEGVFINRTCKVGSYQPNGFGLYDMHGNVFEWCSDWFDEKEYATGAVKDPQGPKGPLTQRVVRGGSYSYNGYNCRSAYRDSFTPNQCKSGLGLRVVCVPKAR